MSYVRRGFVTASIPPQRPFGLSSSRDSVARARFAMRLTGIELPTPLLRAAESGRLVVFAGAGVSMPSPSSYPDFEKLTIEIGNGSPFVLDTKVERFERYLGRLQTAGIAVHE